MFGGAGGGGGGLGFFGVLGLGFKVLGLVFSFVRV